MAFLELAVTLLGDLFWPALALSIVLGLGGAFLLYLYAKMLVRYVSQAFGLLFSF